jgi:hypothetical protein
VPPSGECHFIDEFRIIILTSATFVSVELGTFGVLGNYANSGTLLTVIIIYNILA